MAKALHRRQVNQRIVTGIIADAAIGPFYRVSPGSTLERLTTEVEHPYKTVWNWINSFYKVNGWSELSKENLAAVHKQIKCNGSCNLKRPVSIINTFYSMTSLSITPEQIVEAARRWDEYGWANYEQVKAEKISVIPKALKWTARGALILSGLDFLAEL